MNEQKQIEALKKIQATLGSLVGDDSVEMTFDKFYEYAQAQVAKAISEPHALREPRLRALRAAVEKATSDFNVMSATNVESQSIKVTVYSEPTTASDEESTKELTPTQAANSGGATSASQMNTSLLVSKADDVKAAIANVTKHLGGAKPPAPVATPEKPRLPQTVLAKNDGVDEDGWPDNLNDSRYRETKKSTTAPDFGYDSAEPSGT